MQFLPETPANTPAAHLATADRSKPNPALTGESPVGYRGPKDRAADFASVVAAGRSPETAPPGAETADAQAAAEKAGDAAEKEAAEVEEAAESATLVSTKVEKRSSALSGASATGDETNESGLMDGRAAASDRAAPKSAALDLQDPQARMDPAAGPRRGDLPADISRGAEMRAARSDPSGNATRVGTDQRLQSTAVSQANDERVATQQNAPATEVTAATVSAVSRNAGLSDGQTPVDGRLDNAAQAAEATAERNGAVASAGKMSAISGASNVADKPSQQNSAGTLADGAVTGAVPRTPGSASSEVALNAAVNVASSQEAKAGGSTSPTADMATHRNARISARSGSDARSDNAAISLHRPHAPSSASGPKEAHLPNGQGLEIASEKAGSEIAAIAIARREERFAFTTTRTSAPSVDSVARAQSGVTLLQPKSGVMTQPQASGETSDSRGIGTLIPAEPLIDMIWEPGRASTSPQVQIASPLRADLGQHAMRQIIDVMPPAGGKPVEIALSPHELGRVRMSVSAEDRSVTVQVIAERPETLDLMRRNIDQLGANLRQMGYETISFSFGNGTDSGQTASDDRQSTSSQTIGPDTFDAGENVTMTERNTGSMTGLDLRL